MKDNAIVRRLALALLVTSACGAALWPLIGSNLAAAQPPPADKTARRALEPAAGKPVSPIGIGYELAAPPRLGEMTRIAVTIKVARPLRNATLALGGSEGLTVAGATSRRLAEIPAGGSHVETIGVTALVLDVLYLTVIVEGEMDGAVEARSLAVPLRLTASRRTGSAAVERDQTGQAIRSMPAH